MDISLIKLDFSIFFVFKKHFLNKKDEKHVLYKKYPLKYKVKIKSD